MQGTQGQGSGTQGSGNKPTLSWSQPAAQKPISTPPPQAPKQMPPKQGGDKEKSWLSSYAGIFAGGLIVGVIIGWGIHSMRSDEVAISKSSNQATSSTSTKSTSTKTNTSAAEGTNSNSDIGLTVPTPQASGLFVSISRASVSKPTWAVVYEDHNGVPGNALGAALFFPTSMGGLTSGTVELLRGTLPGHTYLVGESLDDGDKMFSSASDKPVRDEKGNPILVQFKTN